MHVRADEIKMENYVRSSEPFKCRYGMMVEAKQLGREEGVLLLSILLTIK